MVWADGVHQVKMPLAVYNYRPGAPYDDGRGAWTVVRDNRPRQLTAWMKLKNFVRLRSRLVTRFSRRVGSIKMVFYFTRCCSIVTHCTDDVTPCTNGVTSSERPVPRWFLEFRCNYHHMVTSCLGFPAGSASLGDPN